MKVRALVMMAVSVASLLSVTVFEMPKRVVYNGSASSRIGFYWIDNVPVGFGDFVFLQVPDSVRKLIETRHYLQPNVPLIKRIVAVEGDEVCRNGRNISVNGGGMGLAKSEDIFGRSLPVWTGCKVLTKDQILVLQFHPDSFDGRYFGPVNRDLIIGRATWFSFPWTN